MLKLSGVTFLMSYRVQLTVQPILLLFFFHIRYHLRIWLLACHIVVCVSTNACSYVGYQNAKVWIYVLCFFVLIHKHFHCTVSEHRIAARIGCVVPVEKV